MLIDNCTKLDKLVQDAAGFRKYAADLSSFQDRQGKIEPLVAELRATVVAMRAFRENQLINFDCNQKADDLAVEATTALSEFQKDRGWLIQKFKGKQFQAFEAKVKTLKYELEEHLRLAWEAHKKRRMPNTNLELLGLFEKEPSWKVTVQRVRSRISKINAVDFPKDLAQFQKIEQEIDNLITDWHSLSSDEVPLAVQDFLRAATTHGASIDILTPEVKAWLNEKGFSRFFYIRVSN
jgi:hypothetical protein